MLNLIIDHQVPGDEFGVGLPIGNLTSQYFANLYLGELDQFLKDKSKVKYYLRYMDDFILFSENKEKLRRFLQGIRVFLKDNLELKLKEKVTTLAPISSGVPFLGMRIFPGLIRIQRANLIRLRQKIKKRESQFESGEITIDQMKSSVESMIAHVSIANSLLLRRKIFQSSSRFG